MKEKTIGAPTSIINAFHKIAKDRKVIPDISEGKSEKIKIKEENDKK